MDNMNNEIWLTVLRGAVERSIDKLLSDDCLINCRKVFESMKPAIKNSDDAIFGYVFGYVIGSLETIFNAIKRQATVEETKEITNAVSKRIMEIRSRIYQTKI